MDNINTLDYFRYYRSSLYNNNICNAEKEKQEENNL